MYNINTMVPVFSEDVSVVCVVLISIPVGNVTVNVFYQCMLIFKFILYDGVNHFTQRSSWRRVNIN